MPTIPAATSEVQSFFAEHGYYHAKGVFNPAEVAELETDFDRIVDQLIRSNENINAKWGGADMEEIGKDTIIYHTHNVQQYSAAWTRALFHPRFLELSTAILGPDIILHHTKLFQKPSEKGSPFPMHQDWDYFPTIKDTMIAGVIHVSKATDEMGCLRVVPGSHRLGRVVGTGSQRESEVLAAHPLESAMPVEAEPGDVVFFHYFTLHGSLPNRSQDIRKTVLVQLHAGDDVMEDGYGHPYERLTLQGWNHHATRSGVNQKNG